MLSTISCTKETVKEITGPTEYDTLSVIDTFRVHDTTRVTTYKVGKGTAFAALQAYIDQNYLLGDYVDYMSLTSLSNYNSDNSTAYGVTVLGTNSWDIYGILYSNADASYYEYEFIITYNGSGDPDKLTSWTVDDLTTSLPLQKVAFKR